MMGKLHGVAVLSELMDVWLISPHVECGEAYVNLQEHTRSCRSTLGLAGALTNAKRSCNEILIPNAFCSGRSRDTDIKHALLGTSYG